MHRAALLRDGFVMVRGLLPPDDFRQLTKNVDRYIREVVPDLDPAAAFYLDRSRPETLKQLQNLQRDPYFDRLRRSPVWAGLAESLLDEPIELPSVEWFNKPAGSASPTPPHQDNYYFNLVPPQVVTLWMALERVDEENGCLRYVAGSHLQGVRPHAATAVLGFSQGITDYRPDDAAREIAVTLAPGDIVAHLGNTIHRADANTSQRGRRALALVCRGVSCRCDEEAFARYQAALQAQHQALAQAGSSQVPAE